MSKVSGPLLSEYEAATRQPDALPEVVGALPRFIKAEANLLRLPLFALDTKGLKTLDGIECRGERTDRSTGERYEFTFRTVASRAYHYPGPLARAAHLAFLSIATERGFPLQNPITWGWRDLSRRMDMSYAGAETIRALKASIKSVASLSIESKHAIYSKPDRATLSTNEQVLHLYDQVEFRGVKLPDGTVSETNRLWLSDWFLASLNAFFSAPLDYDLWRALDRSSHIASRLYEFFLLNFYSGTPRLHINYETLAQFLPVVVHPYVSLAKQQLIPAFRLLSDAGLIANAAWLPSKTGRAVLHIYPGKRLAPQHEQPPAAGTLEEADFTGEFSVRELRGLKPPEWAIVTDFYRLLSGDERHRPTAKELAQAHEIVEQNGQTKAKSLMPLVVKQLKTNWPEAKTFTAALRYLPEAAADYDREQRRIENERREQLLRKHEQDEHDRRLADQKKLETTWRPAWESLSESERDSLQQEVLAKNRHLARVPKLLERFSIRELARRRAAQQTAA